MTPSISRLTTVGSLLLAAGLHTAAHALPISITNPGFEAANLTLVGNGVFSQLVPGSGIFAQGGTLDGWTIAFSSTDSAGGGFAPAALPLNWTTTWWSGNNIAYLQASGNVQISLSQTVGTLASNSVYTLSALTGNRAFPGDSNYAIQLLAGNAVVATGGNSVPADDTSGMDTVVYNSGPSNPLAGLALTIRLLAIGNPGSSNSVPTEAFFDDISLDAVANPAPSSVPEPGSMALVMVGLLGAIRYRKRLGTAY
ncbi:MAG: PEP-CTERM sorting domain-containing protein [Bryobacteraceae bacterium]